jgi:hypothetical protein
MEITALAENKVRIRPAIKGKLSRVIAGMLMDPTSITRPGSLPSVRNNAIDVARKPIARMPTKSKRATNALKERKTKKVILSPADIKLRERFTTFNIL